MSFDKCRQYLYHLLQYKEAFLKISLNISSTSPNLRKSNTYEKMLNGGAGGFHRIVM